MYLQHIKVKIFHIHSDFGDCLGSKCPIMVFARPTDYFFEKKIFLIFLGLVVLKDIQKTWAEQNLRNLSSKA